MKTFVRATLLILLVAGIVFGTAWYLLEYDTDFTHDALLYGAQYFEEKGQPGLSTWLYDKAYLYGQSIEHISLELAEYYTSTGNYAKVESTLKRAIDDGGGVDIYIALSKAFLAQDKLLDALQLVESVTDPALRSKLDLLRPAAPTPDFSEGHYNEHISVSFRSDSGSIYVSDKDIPSIESQPHSDPITLESGETVLYSVAVGESGLVSPLTTHRYVIFGVVEKVTFADEKMEEAIRAAASIPYGVTVYTNDLWDVLTFEIPEEAQDFSDLKYLPFLEKLTVPESSASLSPIRDLKHLTHLSVRNTFMDQETLQAVLCLTGMKELTLHGCGITSLNGFEQLTGLTYLDIGSNVLTDITPLAGMTGLKVLTINNSAVVDLSALQNMTALRELNLSMNSIKDVTPLASLPALEKLDLNNNQISNIRPLGKLVGLTHLDLSNNKISSVSYLSTCLNLQELTLANNTISGITSLASLVNLERLDVTSNSISTLPSFPKKCALTALEAANNKITSIKPLSGLENLNTVNLDNNPKLSKVSDLANCTKLVSLSVFGTKVKEVSELTEQGIVVYYNPI